jgi:RES domain-containing protein
MLDLREPSLLRSLGVGDTELGSDDHTACRKVGGAAAWLGYDAILVPSARGAGDNLIIFIDKQEPDALLEVLDSQDVEK